MNDRAYDWLVRSLRIPTLHQDACEVRTCRNATWDEGNKTWRRCCDQPVIAVGDFEDYCQTCAEAHRARWAEGITDWARRLVAAGDAEDWAAGQHVNLARYRADLADVLVRRAPLPVVYKLRRHIADLERLITAVEAAARTAA